MKRARFAGANGLLAEHIVKPLLDKGHDIVGIIRVSITKFTKSSHLSKGLNQ